MLIVADGEDVRDLLPSDDETVRLIHLAGRTEIGEKRNFGCAEAHGSVILHWDDDDFSAAGRIADQVDRLIANEKSVTGYGRMRFTDGRHWWQFSGQPGRVLGTSLCYHRSWWERSKFLSIQIGEDNHFAENAWCAGQLITADAGDLMYATIHRENTSPRSLSGSDWRQIS